MKQIINFSENGPPGDEHNAEKKQNKGGREALKKKGHYRKQKLIIGNNSSDIQVVEEGSFLCEQSESRYESGRYGVVSES
nr:unnamed protein product [Callosobruchus analis]